MVRKNPAGKVGGILQLSIQGTRNEVLTWYVGNSKCQIWVLDDDVKKS